MSHVSVLELLLDNAREASEKTAAKVKRGGAYQDVSWRAVADSAEAIAAGLIALGVQPQERVCLIANSRLEWVTSDFGILAAGAVTVAVYPSNLPDEVQYIAEDSGAVVAIVEDAAQTEKLQAERSRLPNLHHVVQIDDEVDHDRDEWVMSLSQLIERGKGSRTALPERRASLNRDSILTLIYTSGTTGRPKGVAIRHGAMLFLSEANLRIDLVRSSDINLLFLPLAHSYAKLIEVGWVSSRHVLAFAESIDTVRDNLLEVRPTVMAAVPRFFEKIHTAIQNKGTQAGGFKAALFHAACDASAAHGEALMSGQPMALVELVRYRALQRTVFRKIAHNLRAALGGRMRAMVSGGAPISPALLWFFKDAGLPILEGYGLTETAAGGTVNRPSKIRIGTVGQVLPGVEVRIAADGEILFRGPNVMREYWNNQSASAEALGDGWFHTGDIGELSADGYLRITDRKKDLIITAGGKNVAPQKIENLFKNHELISQMVVHGDRRKFLSALLTLDADTLRIFCGDHDLGAGSYAEMSQKPAIKREVEKIVAHMNESLPSFETIKKFKILENDFSQQSGELTPTLKVKRKVVSERYKEVLDGFYDEVY